MDRSPHLVPPVSVIVLNYNGARWIERCLASLKAQTIFPQIEVIVADNRSEDGSDETAAKLLIGWPNARFIQHGANLGFCEGNNRAAASARGEYLFFLNNDTWLEPDCLENLVESARSQRVGAATPLVLNYDDDSVQLVFGVTFDIFGLPAFAQPQSAFCEIFMPPGCSYLVETNLFRQLGGFDKEIFLYSDELDLSWRIWIAGRTCAGIQTARLHHRWAANVNPKGHERAVEFRTSDSKRFYSNRNNLVVLLKNAQHILLLMVPMQLALFGIEAIAGWILLRRWSFFKRTYLEAIAGCWRMRHHIKRERRRINALRRRSDWWLLRFLGWRLNRWDELQRVRRFGVPKVTTT